MRLKKSLLAAALLAVGMLSIQGCQKKDTYAIENDHVKVAEYRGISVKKMEPVTVDADYLAEKFAGVVEYYNSFMNTSYSGTDDDTVAAVTGGSFSTYDDWCENVRAGYTRGEQENATTDMAQAVWNVVFQNSELGSYTKEEYEDRKQSVEESMLAYDDVKTVEDYCKVEDITEEQYQKILDETTLYFLKYYAILDAIGEQEGICPTKEEIQTNYIDEHMKQLDSEAGSEEWNAEYEAAMELYDDYYYSELINRVFNFLYENADIK